MLNHIKSLAAVTCIAATSTVFTATPSKAGNDPFIGEIIMFGGNFCPRGWASLEGQLLPIANNTALFSILGTTFGGDGRSTMGLPDMRGRAPLGIGRGSGLTNRALGAKYGRESHVITEAQMPSHTHTATADITADTTSTLRGNPSPASSLDPASNLLSVPATEKIYGNATSVVNLDNKSIRSVTDVTATVTNSATGGNSALQLMPPSMGMRFCIALVGTFPSRN